jgi:predicted glycosyltransferase involved in capsule biosynthesis
LSEDEKISQFFKDARASYTRKIESINRALSGQTPIKTMEELDQLFIRPMFRALEAIYSDQIILMTVYEQLRSNDAKAIRDLDQRVNRGEKYDDWWEKTFRSESEIANGESNSNG